MVVVVPREQLPEKLQPRVGQQLAVQRQDGTQFPVTVTDVSAATVTLDANHALAGKSLRFDLELVAVL